MQNNQSLPISQQNYRNNIKGRITYSPPMRNSATQKEFLNYIQNNQNLRGVSPSEIKNVAII